jgi:hypothetical protein
MAEEAGACDRRAVVGARRGQVEHERVDVGARLRTRVEGVVSRLRAATRKAGHCDGNVRAGVRHGKVRRAIAEVHRVACDQSAARSGWPIVFATTSPELDSRRKSFQNPVRRKPRLARTHSRKVKGENGTKAEVVASPKRSPDVELASPA